MCFLFVFLKSVIYFVGPWGATCRPKLEECSQLKIEGNHPPLPPHTYIPAAGKAWPELFLFGEEMI